jgi:hypothetical protein
VSKFAGIFDEPKSQGRAKKSRGTSAKKSASSKKVPPQSKAAAGRGRPAGPAGGKRSDPDFTQTTAYVRKNTLNDVKVALLREGKGRDYSELVEDLLRGWLKSRS